VQQQIPMLVYLRVSLFVSTFVSISFYVVVLHNLFHYHYPNLCELIHEESILLTLFFVYNWPSLCQASHSL
jgi:hypothetical protein